MKRMGFSFLLVSFCLILSACPDQNLGSYFNPGVNCVGGIISLSPFVTPDQPINIYFDFESLFFNLDLLFPGITATLEAMPSEYLFDLGEDFSIDAIGINTWQATFSVSADEVQFLPFKLKGSDGLFCLQ